MEAKGRAEDGGAGKNIPAAEVGETKPLQQKEKTTQTGVRAVHLSHHDGIYGGNQQTVDLKEVGLIGLIQAITIIF